VIKASPMQRKHAGKPNTAAFSLFFSPPHSAPSIRPMAKAVLHRGTHRGGFSLALLVSLISRPRPSPCCNGRVRAKDSVYHGGGPWGYARWWSGIFFLFFFSFRLDCRSLYDLHRVVSDGLARELYLDRFYSRAVEGHFRLRAFREEH
jgi:hypothetical protein